MPTSLSLVDTAKVAFEEDRRYFPTPLQQFQFLDKYSRWNETLGRRETWVETVDRTVESLHGLAGDRVDSDVYQRIRSGILTMRVMPSMRLLSMAGPAFSRSHITGYNCAYSAVDDLAVFHESLLISMSGCGFGFSVEQQYVGTLPVIREQGNHHPDAFVIEDSAEGWAQALRFGIERWFDGGDVQFDFSLIRPMGSILRTKGGRASGPDPLRDMLAFTRRRILSRQGSTLRPLDVHDIMCSIGNAAVSGGVRRTALISLFDPEDTEMLHCKDGDFSEENSQRWNANNSAVWTTITPGDRELFTRQFDSMFRAGRGEPGFFYRGAARATIPARRDANHIFGVNPCSEIILRNQGFCNLSAAIVRPDDTLESLRDKVELATIIGSIQSMATHFPGLRPIWQRNAEEERLLGVDITGQMDNPALLTEGNFSHLREHAVRTNAFLAPALGINQSAAITCVKPSGNTSQLVDCSSGLHSRWAPYYIRNVRVSASSPLARVLLESGAPMSPENGHDPASPRTWVVSFPVKTPAQAITRKDRSALDQCEWWLRNKVHWTEHNPSITVTYRPDEVDALMEWVWEHRDLIGGMAFLPVSDADYEQLPYIEIDEAEYTRRLSMFPDIDWSLVTIYEKEDRTTAAQELACSSGLCEV